MGQIAGFDLKSLHNVLQEIIIKSSSTILRDFQELEKIDRSKMNKAKFIHVAKAKMFEKLSYLLSKYFPDHSVKINSEITNDNFLDNCFSITLIDSESNFINNIPHFASHLTLWRKNKPFYTIVYDPTKKETFYAMYGKGFYFNNKRFKNHNLNTQTDQTEKKLVATNGTISFEKHKNITLYSSILNICYTCNKRFNAGILKPPQDILISIAKFLFMESSVHFVLTTNKHLIYSANQNIIDDILQNIDKNITKKD